MVDKNITLYDVMLAMEEGFEKIDGKLNRMDKRLERIEASLTAEGSQKEEIDRRVSHLEQALAIKLPKEEHPMI